MSWEINLGWEISQGLLGFYFFKLMSFQFYHSTFIQLHIGSYCFFYLFYIRFFTNSKNDLIYLESFYLLIFLFNFFKMNLFFKLD